MADDDKDDDSRGVLIAAMALSIPILGILAVFGGMAYVPWVIITALVLVGGTFSAIPHGPPAPPPDGGTGYAGAPHA